MHLNTEQSVFLLWVAALSLMSFSLFGFDKEKSRRHAWRISESTLFTAALIGGAFRSARSYSAPFSAERRAHSSA